MKITDTTIDVEYQGRFQQAMDDDFNTPVVLAVLFDLARELNRLKATDMDKAAVLAGTLLKLADILGILQDDPENFLKGGEAAENGITEIQIEQFIQQRLEARKSKDWATADRIRDELKSQGIVLEDVSGGTNWRRE